MIGGPYVLLAAGVAFVATAGYGAYQYQRAEAATTKTAMAEGQRDRAIQAVKAQEAQLANILAKQKALDDAIRERDVRNAQLEKAKRALKGELDELKKALPQPDQDCLNRPLPAVIRDRLLDS